MSTLGKIDCSATGASEIEGTCCVYSVLARLQDGDVGIKGVGQTVCATPIIGAATYNASSPATSRSGTAPDTRGLVCVFVLLPLMLASDGG